MNEETPPQGSIEMVALQAIARSNEWLRAVLCTLARRGSAYRQSQPEAAQMVLDTLSRLPWYKGGQFLFDLLEWEDFLLDGPPPPILPTTLDDRSLATLAGWLRAIQAALDGAVQAGGAVTIPAITGISFSPHPLDADLPPLSSADDLYPAVVLGILTSAVRGSGN